jgi:hypothetical protein
LLDATCTPADIKYPTDIGILNEAREKTEKIIDKLYKELVSAKFSVRHFDKTPKSLALKVFQRL